MPFIPTFAYSISQVHQFYRYNLVSQHITPVFSFQYFICSFSSVFSLPLIFLSHASIQEPLGSGTINFAFPHLAEPYSTPCLNFLAFLALKYTTRRSVTPPTIPISKSFEKNSAMDWKTNHSARSWLPSSYRKHYSPAIHATATLSCHKNTLQEYTGDS